MQGRAAQEHSRQTKLLLLATMRDGETVSSAEIARRLKVPVNGLGVHFKIMAAAGWVRIVKVTENRTYLWQITPAGRAQVTPSGAPRPAIRKVTGRRDGLCLPDQPQITISLPAEPWHTEENRA